MVWWKWEGMGVALGIEEGAAGRFPVLWVEAPGW